MSRDLVEAASAAAKDKWGRIFGTSLLVALLLIVPYLIFYSATIAMILSGQSIVLVTVVAVILALAYVYFALGIVCGFYKYLLNVYDGKGKCSELFKDLGNVKLILKVFGVSALLSIAALLIATIANGILSFTTLQSSKMVVEIAGVILCILAFVFYVWFILRLELSTIIPIYENKGPIVSIKESFKRMKGKVLPYILAVIKLVWIPVIIYFAGWIFFISLGSLGSKFAIAGSIIYFVAKLIYTIWFIVILPKMTMLPIALYKKSMINEESSGTDTQ